MSKGQFNQSSDTSKNKYKDGIENKSEAIGKSKK
jgi:hypothetical protein